MAVHDDDGAKAEVTKLQPPSLISQRKFKKERSGNAFEPTPNLCIVLVDNLPFGNPPLILILIYMV